MGWGGVGWGMLTFVWTCWACLNLFEAEIAFRLGKIHIYLENHQIQTSEFQSFCDRWIVFSPRRNDDFLKTTVFHDLTFPSAGIYICIYIYIHCFLGVGRCVECRTLDLRWFFYPHGFWGTSGTWEISGEWQTERWPMTHGSSHGENVDQNGYNKTLSKWGKHPDMIRYDHWPSFIMDLSISS